MAERRIVRKPRHVFRELFVVSDREDIAVLARVDELRHTADVRADGRAAGAHTLENGVREGLGHRGQQIDVHRTEKRHDGRNPAAERHALTHAELVAQLFQHICVLAVARNEQAQLRRGLERLREAAHGRRDVLDGGQTRRDATEHIPLLDLRAVGLAEVGCTVELALRAVEFHAVVYLYDALRVKAALDERARHAVRDRLIEVEKAQRDGVCRAEGVLLERTAEVVQTVVRMHGRYDGDVAAAPHHRAHQVRAAAVAVDDVRLELVHQIAHGPRRAERIVPLDDAHINTPFSRLVRKRTGPERDQHDVVRPAQSGYGIHNLGLGAANVASAHHMHHSQVCILPAVYVQMISVYHTVRPNAKKRSLPRGRRRKDSLVFRCLLVLEQGIQLVHKGIDILELAVDRCKAHIGHLVDRAQLLHDQLADGLARDLALERTEYALLDIIHDLLELHERNRTLLARLDQTAEQLLPVIGLPRAVALDEHERHTFYGFVCGKTLEVLEAFTPTPDARSLIGRSRINNLAVIMAAKRTFHSAPPLHDTITCNTLRILYHPLYLHVNNCTSI